MNDALLIRPALTADQDRLFAYLNDHMSDNGSGGTAMFMPVSRAESVFPPEKEAAFRKGMETPVGLPGWRRAWLALAADGSIAGHVDLRARPEKVAAHRALLGMGVHRAHRQLGLGRRLLDVATAWAASEGFAWIDLEVLSVNRPAIALYRRAGFTLTGQHEDMYRIDGESLGYTMMSMQLGQARDMMQAI